MPETRVTMEVGDDGVSVITISNPPVNAISMIIVDGLKKTLEESMSRADVKAIVLAGDGGEFCGGFDISIIHKTQTTGDISLLPNISIEIFLNLIEDANKPIVAATEGFTLGVGLEMAMACHARIASTKTQFGLTEFTLGLIPGAGGSQRLPRLIGMEKALYLMLSSKWITSEEGKKLGLVDAVVPSVELLKVCRLWALDIARRQKPWICTLHKTDKLCSLAEVHDIIHKARQHAKQTAKNMPMHQACLDVVEDGIIHGAHHGLLKEFKVFKELVFTDTSRGLVHAFFALRATKKLPNVSNIGLKPRPIKKVAIIGGGLMGSGIATALLVNDFYVILKEINSGYLLKGVKSIEENIRGLVSNNRLAQNKAEKAFLMLKGTLDYSEFGDVDMVIETVIENIALKHKLFAEIEMACPPHCIFASNTSTIDLNIVGAKTTSQDRIVGAHFFSPAHVMPLIEVVRTEKTSPQVILDLMTVGKMIKKVPIVVRNCTGLAVNRTFFPYLRSAHLLVNLGVDVFRIDQLIRNFGLPIGPFQFQDLSGYGVAVATTKEFASSFTDQTFESPLDGFLIKNGRNGNSNGKGYYIYKKGVEPEPDLTVLPIIEESRRLTNIMPGGKPISVTDEEIVEMVFFPVVNEACRVLDDGIVVRASDLDVASVLGMSFPSYRGGIIFWADTIGADRVYRSLLKWSEFYGIFYTPSRFLVDRATRGIPLSAPASTSSGTRPRL